MRSQARSIKEKILSLPDSPGVYFFLGEKRKILYIGKATSLRSRVKSYFSRDIMSTRGPLIAKMIEEIRGIKFIETDSVLEALILEANEIKKHQPYYNSREKDDKSHNYVVVTKEEFPRILVVRGRDLLSEKKQETRYKIQKSFGPFPHGAELREALKIVRKIFPYRDEKCRIGKVPKPCFPAQLGLCPGPCAGWISKADYRKNIRHITMFFEAKKDKLIQTLEKEMQSMAKRHRFEEAERVKRQIYALQHIQDVALIKADLTSSLQTSNFRIEAYDIAHLSGKETVGVMTVVEDGELAKSQYRKFKIKGQRSKVNIDDTQNLKEILSRRFNHPEWRLPDLIVVDGGVAQINAAKEVVKDSGLNIDVVSVVKDERHKARQILLGSGGSEEILGGGVPSREKSRDGVKGFSQLTPELEKAVLIANSEAHRFAIKYHRLLRGKGFRI